MAILRHILRAVGWSVAGLLGGAFLIGYAAPYLPPAQFWWTDLFAVVLPPLGGAVGALGLGLLGQGLARRRWGRVAVAGVLLGLVAVRFGPGALGSGGAKAGTAPLRLMTFNLPPSLAQESASASTLRRLVHGEAPDVLALQESWMKTGASSRSALNSVSWSMQVLLDDTPEYGSPRETPTQTTIYQPVLGRFVLDSLSVHPLPPAGETNPRSRYTRTQFTWQGRPAVLYNVHLHTVGVRPWDLLDEWSSIDRWRSFLRTYRDGAVRRAEQARRIRRRIEQEARPVLIAGDFNSTPHQWAYRHIAQGLQRVDDEAWGWTATFPAHRPLVQIDHILAGPAWTVVGAHVPHVSGMPAVSDHRPVVGQLRWRED